MENSSPTVNNKLWTRTFVTVSAANFLLFFSFYQLLPILPLFIIDKFRTDNATAGFIISRRVSDVYVGHIGLAVGRGALISMLLVLSVLPQLAMFFDRHIIKTSDNLEEQRL